MNTSIRVLEKVYNSFRIFSLFKNSDVFLIDAMSGKAFICFLHNLCEHPNTCYLEIGSWKGSPLFSAMNESNVFFLELIISRNLVM